MLILPVVKISRSHYKFPSERWDEELDK